MGEDVGVPVGGIELIARDDVAAGLCPNCAVDKYEVVSEDGRFIAACPVCGKRGPEAGSLYEATESWKQMFGVPARSMSRMVWMIAGGLCLLGAVVAVAGLLLN